MSESEIKRLQPAQIPEKENMIKLVEGLLDDIKADRLVAFSFVGIGIGDDYFEYAITPKGTRTTMIEALNLIQSRMAHRVLLEHDDFSRSSL